MIQQKPGLAIKKLQQYDALEIRVHGQCEKNFRNICLIITTLIYSETTSTDMQINGLRLIYLMAAEVSREIQARKQSKAPSL